MITYYHFNNTNQIKKIMSVTIYTSRTTHDNLAKYYFTHCVEGINPIILGDSYLNTFISRDNYEIWLQMEKKNTLLENHHQLIPFTNNTGQEANSIILKINGVLSVVYRFSVPNNCKREYIKFRNGKAKEFTKQFKTMIKECSGYPKGTAMLSLIDDDQVPYYYRSKLGDIINLELFDYPDEIPFLNKGLFSTMDDLIDYVISLTELRENEEWGKLRKGIAYMIDYSYHEQELKPTKGEFIETYF